MHSHVVIDIGANLGFYSLLPAALGYETHGFDLQLDCQSEEGREANRRIEFRLIRPDTVELPGQTTLESLAQSSDTEADQVEEGPTDEQN